MSKRQGGTYTTRTPEGNVARHRRPLTKGKASIIAREILGPGARVFQACNGAFHVGIYFGQAYTPGGSFRTVATGVSWEAVLETAKGTHEAGVWKTIQLQEDNKLAEAVNSLQAARVKVAQSRIARAKELVESAWKKRKVFTTRKAGGKSYRVGKDYNAPQEVF